MKVHSFLNTVVLVNGVEIQGWADGDDVIQISRRNDSASDRVGADGNMMMSISADRSGSFTFRLMQTSSSNKYLMSLVALMEGGARTFVPVQVSFQDTYRNDNVTGVFGYITKPTDVTRGGAGQTQEWTIVVERLDLLLGDPLLVGAATAIGNIFG